MPSAVKSKSHSKSKGVASKAAHEKNVPSAAPSGLEAAVNDAPAIFLSDATSLSHIPEIPNQEYVEPLVTRDVRDLFRNALEQLQGNFDRLQSATVNDYEEFGQYYECDDCGMGLSELTMQQHTAPTSWCTHSEILSRSYEEYLSLERTCPLRVEQLDSEIAKLFQTFVGKSIHPYEPEVSEKHLCHFQCQVCLKCLTSCDVRNHMASCQDKKTAPFQQIIEIDEAAFRQAETNGQTSTPVFNAFQKSLRACQNRVDSTQVNKDQVLREKCEREWMEVEDALSREMDGQKRKCCTIA